MTHDDVLARDALPRGSDFTWPTLAFFATTALIICTEIGATAAAAVWAIAGFFIWVGRLGIVGPVIGIPAVAAAVWMTKAAFHPETAIAEEENAGD